MTTGQRISDKRKELGMSQEALGEKLGVSRQSIYKWESDTSLPDIDKLIALSRLFGVPVGWLLGVEDISSPPLEQEQSPEEEQRRQEAFVESVLRRYQAAQSKPQKTAWDKWFVRIPTFLCVVLLIALVSMNTKLNNLYSKYHTLYTAVDQISTDNSWAIDRLTQRMENILKSQNELSVDFTCEIADFDLLNNTVTFDLSVTPKTYTEGMCVLFQGDSAGKIIEQAAQRSGSQTFKGTLTCPLSDSVALSAVFITDDIRQVQVLNEYTYLYQDSLPDYKMRDTGWRNLGTYDSAGHFDLKEQYVIFDTADNLTQYKTPLGIIEVASVDVGLFKNRKLVQWLEPASRPTRFEGKNAKGIKWTDLFHDGYSYFHSPVVDDMKIAEGDVLHFAARVTDQTGRVTIVLSEDRYTMRNGQFLALNMDDPDVWTDPTQYQFESEVLQ